MTTQKKANSFGLRLASRLCSIVNDSPSASVEVVLAEYLLKHYNTLGTLNIYSSLKIAMFPAAVSIVSAASWVTRISANSSFPAAMNKIPISISPPFLKKVFPRSSVRRDDSDGARYEGQDQRTVVKPSGIADSRRPHRLSSGFLFFHFRAEGFSASDDSMRQAGPRRRFAGRS